MSLADDFGTFWQHYPRKVGKLAAQRAYQKARKIATAEDILGGIDRYVKAKPSYADFCHPTSFLNQGRWLDEVDAQPSVPQRPFTAREVQEAEAMRRAWGRCQHHPSCPNYQACVGTIIRNWREKRGDAA